MKEETKKRDGIYERIKDSGVWYIHYHDGEGKRRREKVGTWKAAKARLERRRTEARDGISPEAFRKRPITFSELADWALPTRNRYLALMKLTYRLAERGQRIKVNPARLVRQTKENNGRVRWLMEDEEKKLRAIIEKKYSDHLPEFEISLMTGMRQEEQFSVTWDCVDLKAGIINLEETKNGTGRMVRLNSRALAVMNMLHESSIGTGPVFLLNKKPRWFKDAVDEAMLVDFTWHCLRHTWATRLLQKGVDVKAVQEMGGWKTIAMVMRYTHADPRRFGPALEKLCEVSATNNTTQGEHTQPQVAHGVQ